VKKLARRLSREKSLVRRKCVFTFSSLCFLPFALAVGMSVARAQGPTSLEPRELHGQVYHADGKPFAQGVLVRVDNEHGGTTAQMTTDSRGRFEALGLDKARYSVSVHVAGYRDEMVEVDLDTVPRATVQIVLHELVVVHPMEKSPAALGAQVSVNDLAVPEKAQSEFEKGRKLLLEDHKPAESIASFHKAIQIAPSYSMAYFLMGTAYMDTAKWSDAEAALDKAVSLNGKFGAADLALGGCLVEEKKFAEAEKPLVEGLASSPEAWRGEYDLGRDYYALNRFQEAEPHARKAVALAPDFPDAHVALGNVLLRLRDGPGALAEFQEYLRLAPDGPFAGATRDLATRLKAALAAAQ
jgi:Flp pilus assembly protein TadD